MNSSWYFLQKDQLPIRSFLYSNATLYLQRKYNKFHSIEN